jgi:methylase of polypeptide subunit release factors
LRTPFPLFHSHLDLAQSYWKRLIQPGDTAIDATCGQGYDALFLASLPLKELHVVDIQNLALEKAKEKLQNSATSIVYHHFCHSQIRGLAVKESIKLIVYNLGYLPGSDKSIKTLFPTTLKSIEEALQLLTPGGLISITCYPGHIEGKEEENELLLFSQTLDPKLWSVCFHKFLNRTSSPSLILIQKHCSSL